MRWIAVLALSFVLTWTSRAAGPDDQYLDIYNEILQADNLQQNGHTAEAAAKYLGAQSALKSLQQANPTWNADIVSFRLNYLTDQLKALAKLAPAAPVAPAAPAAPATNAPPPVATAPAKPVTEAANLQEQIRSLMAANAELENKLKEALSVQPAAISPRELAKAEEKITALQKEKDLLSVALEQAKAAKPQNAPSPEADKTARQLAAANQALASLKARSSEDAKAAQAEIQRLKAFVADAQTKLAAAAADAEAMKTARAAEASATAITAERDRLKADLATRTKDLADAEAHRDQNVTELRTQLADLERQRDDLKAKLAAAPLAATAAAPLATDSQPIPHVEILSLPTATAPAATDAQLEQLRARLAVLEAQAVPYTPEELAVLKKNPSALPAQPPSAPSAPVASKPESKPESKHIAHSLRDLPPGAGGLMKDAMQATMERDYAKAGKIYEEILHQDENNVYVLAHLANAQFAMNQMAECEKTVTRSLALDPEDPASLYLLGVLRYRQERLDEALNALSLSAKYNPTNAGTQNYLGCVLSDKGLRPAAETAFRKSLAADPSYADAHYNLAFVYAEEKPPSLELARWHYQRALDLGHGKSQALEKLLAQAR